MKCDNTRIAQWGVFGIDTQMKGGRAVAVLAAGSVLILAGCSYLGPGERSCLREARDLYQQNQSARAAEQLSRLIDDFGGAAEIGEAYYLRGLCRIRMGQMGDAGDDFEKAIDKSKRNDLKVYSRVSLATVAFQQRDWEKAAELYRDCVDDLADTSPTDHILYSAGVAMQRAGLWKDARLQFARVQYKFRQGPAASQARRMSSWQHDYHAIQLGAYRNTEGAQEQVQVFSQAGLPSVRMESRPRDGSPVWIVMAGRYETYDDAAKALPQMRAKQPDAHIIP